MQIRKADPENWVNSMIARHGILFERFMKKTERSNNCWNWNGKKDAYGYGMVSVNKKWMKSHRLMFQLVKSFIPTGFVIRHTCDNTSCVFPPHLISGTHQENMNDRKVRGRGGDLRGENNGRSKITATEALGIKNSDLSLSKLAKNYGISKIAVRYIKIGRNWKHIQGEKQCL